MPGKESMYHALEDYYILEDTIGSGGFAKVKLATHIATNEKVAIKIMSKKLIGKELHRIKQEIEALKSFSHQNICRLYQVVETETMFFIVLEYCSGGELFDYIVEKDRLDEEEARIIFRQLVAAVAYIHSKGYAHRDIKPENVLLDDRRNVKLIDFGLCIKPKGGLNNYLETFCGSPSYVAPEVLRGEVYIGSKSDVWSLGVVLYALLCGDLPFTVESVENSASFEKVQSGTYEKPPWLSSSSRNILDSMIQVDPAKRISVTDLLSHPWLMENKIPMEWESTCSDDSLDAECLAELAMHYGEFIKNIENSLMQKNLDYLNATYYLLLLKKSKGEDVRLHFHKPRPCTRNLASSFNSVASPMHMSMESGLDNADLLLLGSPKKERCSNDLENPSKISPVNNFVMPIIPSTKKSKKIPSTSSDMQSSAAKTPSRSVETTLNQLDIILSTPTQMFRKKDIYAEEKINSPLMLSKNVCRPSPARRVLGSIEKRLDQMRHFLTPWKHQSGSCAHDGPRKVKELYNVTTVTTDVSADHLLESLRRVLVKKAIPCKQKGYCLRGKVYNTVGKVVLTFELEVCRLTDNIQGIRRKRLTGDAWYYKQICEEILNLASHCNSCSG